MFLDESNAHLVIFSTSKYRYWAVKHLFFSWYLLVLEIIPLEIVISLCSIDECITSLLNAADLYHNAAIMKSTRKHQCIEKGGGGSQLVLDNQK